MNKVLLTIIALTLLLSVAGATTDCVTHAPTAYGAYSVVTIDNTQSTATNVSSQQQINLTESSFAPYLVYNNNYANFGYYYQNGTNVTAWIESNVSGKLVTWAKINPSISGISSMDICLGFASTNLLSSSGITGIGEAPQLSSTYAQYDNGNYVFTKYWNFAGTSLPTGWSTGGGGSGSITVNNSIAYSITSGVLTTNYPYTISTSIAMDVYSSQQPSATDWGVAAGLGASPTTLGDDIMSPWWVNGGSYQFQTNKGSWGAGYSGAIDLTSLSYNTPKIFTTYYVPSTSVNFYINYVLGGSAASTYTPSSGALTNIYIGRPSGGNQAAATDYWLRLRTYPPSGVMPTVSYGSIILPTTTTIPTTTSTSTSTSTSVSTSTSSVTTTIPTTTSVSTSTSSVTTTIPTTTSVSTSTSSVTTTIPTTTSVSTTTSTSVPITFTTTINPRNSTLVNATTACKDLPCVLSYSFAIPEVSLIFVFVAFGIAWQVTHKLINGLASALIVAIVMVGIAPTLLNIGVLVVIGFFVVLGYYTHAFERKSREA